MKRPRILPSAICCLCLLALVAAPALAADWPSFRGPNGSGVADGDSYPESWDHESGRNVQWKVDLRGTGFSSPVVQGQRLFVSFFEEVEGKKETLRWVLVAVDRASGKVLWERAVVEEAKRLEHHPASSHANATSAVDDQRIVSILGASTLVAHDLGGKELWRKDLGLLDQGMASDASSQWGHASSPRLWQGVVFVQVDRHRNSYLAAFEAASGKELWRNERNEKPSWSTPAIYRHDGEDVLVTSSPGYVRGYRPKTGEELWRFAIDLQVMVPVPVISEEFVYIAGGYPRGQPIRAIRTSARGDVSLAEDTDRSEHAFLSERGGPYVPSPLLYRGRLYGCTDEGILSAYDPATGKRLWRERVGGTYSASPVGADGKIYLASEEGEVHVVAAGDEYKHLATIDHGERLMATPALVDGTIYLRTPSALLAVRQEAPTAKKEAKATR
ncbi:MAG: PQQ-binding-like beta-propeller repeat protein [Acidobacteriota bacterium]